MMKFLVVALVACAAVAVAEISSPEEMLLSGPGIFDTMAKEKNAVAVDLLTAAKELHRVAPELFQEHSRIITKHAVLLQDNKAKAYTHNFNASKKAIAAALKNLNAQLKAGHAHDKKAVAGEKKLGNGMISKANEAGYDKCHIYKDKACPAKHAESKAKAKKDAAARAMHIVGSVPVCRSIAQHTFGDMDIDKTTPAFGTALRSSWDKSRAKYVAAVGRHTAATKVFNAARRKYQQTIAAYNTALRIEASNAHSACTSAHREFNVLVKDVQSNVSSRKQVWIASLVVTCYVHHITSNSAAKACADRKRRSSTSHWNIHAGKLQNCQSKAALTAKFGPAGWHASNKTCRGAKAINPKEMSAKAVAKKKAAAKEKSAKAKEKSAKAVAKKKAAAEEKSAKAVEKDKKTKARESKTKKDESKYKEKVAKEKTAKEKLNKATKEKNDKAVAKKKAADEKRAKSPMLHREMSNAKGWFKFKDAGSNQNCKVACRKIGRYCNKHEIKRVTLERDCSTLKKIFGGGVCRQCSPSDSTNKYCFPGKVAGGFYYHLSFNPSRGFTCDTTPDPRVQGACPCAARPNPSPQPVGGTWYKGSKHSGTCNQMCAAMGKQCNNDMIKAATLDKSCTAMKKVWGNHHCGVCSPSGATNTYCFPGKVANRFYYHTSFSSQSFTCNTRPDARVEPMCPCTGGKHTVKWYASPGTSNPNCATMCARRGKKCDNQAIKTATLQTSCATLKGIFGVKQCRLCHPSYSTNTYCFPGFVGGGFYYHKGFAANGFTCQTKPDARVRTACPCY